MAQLRLCKRRRLTPPPPKLWLAYLHSDNTQTYYSLSDRRYYFFGNMPTILVCSHGWLILADPQQNRYSLLNPATMDEIHLPPDLIQGDQRFEYCTLSSPPSSTTDCVVMFTIILDHASSTANKRMFVFCRLGDEDWTRRIETARDFYCVCDDRTSNDLLVIGAVGSFNGEIYLFAACCQTLFKFQFDEHHLSHSSVIRLNPGRAPEMPCYGNSASTTWYMDQYSPTELIIVGAAYMFRDHDESQYVENGYIGFHLYKLNLVEEEDELLSWQRIQSLPQDTAVLLGSNAGDILLLRNIDIPEEESSPLLARRNMIYFIRPNDLFLYAYDVRDTSISVSFPWPNAAMQGFFQARWMPPLSCSTTAIADIDDPTTTIIACGKNPSKIIMSSIIVDQDDDMWSGGIPIHLLSSIQSRLFGADRCCFRLACRTWQLSFSTSTYNDQLPSLRNTPHPAFPVLIHIGKDGCDQVMNVFNPITNSTIPLPSSHCLIGAGIHCSKHGWLLLSQGIQEKNLFFYNPFTKERIDLPQLRDTYFWFNGVTFSSPPTSSDCVVFGHMVSSLHVIYGYICRGESSWSNFFEVSSWGFDFKHCFSNPVYHQGLFYLMARDGNLFSVEPRTDSDTKFLNLPSNPNSIRRRSHLLECDGKLMSVCTGHAGGFLQVYELNRDATKWEEVNNLKDKMLFLSSASLLSASSNGAEISGLGNKVFLDRFNGEDGVFYSLATRRFHTLWSGYNNDNWCNTKVYTRCAWIQPNFNTHTKEELRWSWSS